MEDFKKLGWIIFNFIIYFGWIGLIDKLNKLIDVLDWGDSIFVIIVSLLVQYVGGIFVVVIIQYYTSKILNKILYRK